MKKITILTALAVIAVLVVPGFARGDEVYTDNLVIVMDDSASMRGDFNGTSKMEAAKEALRTVLATVPQTTFVGLVALNLTAKDGGWLYDLGSRDDARLTAAIKKLKPNGGTLLGAFIKKGADRLLAQREVQHGYGSYRLLVITDGEAGDADLMDLYAPLVVERGITLDVIGVKMKAKHSLAKIAHSYRSADDPESLKQAIKEVVGEIGGKGSRDAGQEAFEAIAGLPEETAAAVINSFTTSGIGNHPIGTTPTTPVPTVPQPSGGGSASTGSQSGLSGGAVIIGIGIGIFILFIIVAAGASR